MNHSPTARTVSAGPVAFCNTAPFALIAGPCQMESLEHSRMLCARIAEATAPLGIPFVFKASYDKANRSSLDSQRGLGIDKGLEILAAIRDEFGCPVLTDVHDTAQVARAAEVVDILQIPAFLCRQTDLLLAAGETGRVINIKKGQFLAPWDMANVAAKVASTGNESVLLCERGASFGYNMLVSDFRALPIMAETGYPVIYDATHSVQLPGGMGATSGGQRQYVPALASAALAVGAAGIFMETHEDPDNAPSDGPNMVPVDALADVLGTLRAFDRIRKGG
ncbi:3-deoxy-8-phosphooctulonate synthase [Roseisalinus antarcticus]|uniref:2-dehydro-3-deoxyphosphooctonate aldolase n=1 Tax=Roseisalinus antarcticus TaxID=254357 RepID=A0A1Y5TL88_9RHOB|nr:3-deoxy-8-phosphooctulonate synthase [Roseisalinus antarcticus]SLN66215.1 2-dehydro-3-deoxyphosphooctonate aldolase [Roseisalinus antarcticus]